VEDVDGKIKKKVVAEDGEENAEQENINNTLYLNKNIYGYDQLFLLRCRTLLHLYILLC